MFKFMKQGISLAAAVAAAGSCIPVYAAGIQPRTSIQAPDGTGNTETGNGEERNGTSITIDKAVEGHRYKVYQVFKGKVSADGTKLSNVEYGANYSGREGVELKDELAQLEAEGVEAKAFAETVRDLLKGEPAAVLSAENQTAELEAGYYMILDETLYEVDGDSLSDYIVTVAGNVTVQPKSTGVPEFDKSIDDEENPENPDNSEPENPVLPEPEVSPEVADIDWHYTLHEDTGVITLNSYIGSNPDVKVYSHYKTNITGDKVYKAELASNYLEWSEDFNKLYMFCNNQMVESVVFSDALDTSTCTDMSSMFYNCRKLTNIDFGLNFNTKNVVNMKGMFQDCDSLVNLDLKSFDTRNLNNLEVMFQNCSSLTSVDLTSFDTRRVNYMKFMFDGCTSLISADLSSFSNPYLVDATAMFSRCGNLSSVKFGADFNAGRCSKTASMFYNCASLIELDLSGFKTQDLREMTSMFAGCTNLRSVNFGSEFYTGKVFDMSSLFNGCSSLENVDVTGFNTELVTNMNGVFYGCSSLTSLNLEKKWMPQSRWL